MQGGGIREGGRQEGGRLGEAGWLQEASMSIDRSSTRFDASLCSRLAWHVYCLLDSNLVYSALVDPALRILNPQTIESDR